MDTLVQDLRFALRALRKRPGFAAVAALTLALGIGANSAIFSVIRSVLLRPLPYEQPERVVTLWNSWVGWEKTWLSEPEVLDYRGVRAFEHVGAYTGIDANLTGGTEPERVTAAGVTANVFAALGVRPQLGRTFTAEEDVPGRDEVVVLGHGLWRRRFGGDPAVVGSSIELNGGMRTVVGVMPPAFRLPEDYRNDAASELWVPLAMNLDSLNSRGSHYLYGVARLRAGTTLPQANAELDALTRRWVDEGLVPAEARFTAFGIPVEEDVLGNIRPALLVLLGAVGFVLLIACANVANLLLARSDERRREIAVRTAVGAGRGRILTQLLTESLALAAIGGLLGLALAALGIELLLWLNPENIPRVEEVGLDAGVLGFTALVALLTGVLFGLVPALQLSRPDLVGELKEGGRGSTVGRHRQAFRRALIVAEVALSVLLVIGAGLMIRSFVALQRIDLGFRPEQVLTLRMSLPQSDYPDSASVTTFYRQLVERVSTLPEVRVAGAARQLPLSGTIGDWSIEIEGRTPQPHENLHGDWQVVTPGYFEAMGLSLVRGRFLDPTDRADGLPAVVINQTMAESYWPGEEVLGRRFRIGGDQAPWFTIVGVVRDVRHNGVVEEARTEMYFPHEQFPLAVGFAPRGMTLVVRTLGEPLASAQRVREEIRALDPNLPVAEIRSMEQVVSAALSQPRFTMLLLAIFAGVALALAAVGIYGVISYAVTQRTHEMGVRMALGAAPRRVVGLVLGDALLLSLGGIAAGLLAAFFLTRLLESLIYSVRAVDPVTFVAVPLLLTLVALAASYLPARRAARVDPMIALRSE